MVETSFCDMAWQATADNYAKILNLPFIRELAEGTLDAARFRFYVIQDWLYLEEFARALSIAAARAPDAEAMDVFGKSAQGAILVERSLHGGFFKRFGVNRKEMAQARPTPTCHGYSNFLLALACRSSYGQLIAGLLPCFWIYQAVGGHIAAQAGPDNPYDAWIETYSDPDFAASTDAVKAIVDRVAALESRAERDVMLAAYKYAVRFEWMFWDSAYRFEDWPITL
ncbi:MAG: thiaminase II [Hyphomicrobiales bacterium]